MQYTMTVRYNSVEERFVGFNKLFCDTWSCLTAVIETFASVDKSVQFVDVTCGAQARPNWTSIHQPCQDSRTQDLFNAIFTHAVRSEVMTKNSGHLLTEKSHLIECQYGSYTLELVEGSHNRNIVRERLWELPCPYTTGV